MTSLLILLCLLFLLIVIRGLRTTASVSIIDAALFVSCSRPSERKEIGCWLFTVSLWNREQTPLLVDRMEVLSPEGKSLPVLSPPQENPRAALFHHILQYPIALQQQSSTIVIASVVVTPEFPLDQPDRCTLRVHTGGGVRDYPLFRMTFI